MEDIIIEHGNLIIALLVLFVPAMSILLRMWWKVEQRQDEALHNLRISNDEAHAQLRSTMTEQHGQLRDKIEKIWQHLVTHNATYRDKRDGD